MDKRLKLDGLLRSIDGVDNLYFAPATNTKMKFPCIRYELSRRQYSYADNKKFIKHSEYTVTYITRNPDAAIEVCDQIEDMPYSVYDRTYVADGLYHFVYRITL